MLKRKLLLGDEAIAQGAIDAGISGAYSYPGTPSTEIMEYVMESNQAKIRNIHRQWSSNEKTALEAALGAVYSGRRALVSMKHVGLNVAADPFVNSAITGVNGGLVLAVADDPSMHSSQNEQDTRFYAKFARVPLLEPTDQQEAYELTRRAFDLSERFDLPAIIRLTTRLAHSRADVELLEPRPENKLEPVTEHNRYTLIPLNARQNYRKLLDKSEELEQFSEESELNKIHGTSGSDRGVIAAGIGYSYFKECTQSELDIPSLHVSLYPAPKQKILEFADNFEEIVVLEDGQPFLEEFLRDARAERLEIHGRLDGTLPRDGELTPDSVATALETETTATFSAPEDLPGRPPRLCPGCPHADSFEFLREVLEANDEARAFSDIGCYTLGFLPPYEAIHTCVDMGASITMAKGAADAGLHPALAVIGDSTFTHSGMTGLLDAIYENSAITVIILDNATTAMTGGQDSLAEIGLEDICQGLGVEEQHLHVLKPLSTEKDKNLAVLKEEVEHRGVSVLIVRRPCVQI